ncbi:MAG: DUF362 domain-containing protein [bacterium]
MKGRVERILTCLFNQKKITRSQFLKLCAGGLTLLAAEKLLFKKLYAVQENTNARVSRNIKGAFDLVSAHGDDPYKMTIQAVNAMGGMAKFVKKDSVVVIKPNIGWDRTPEQAANTNPQVVAALIDMCRQAGARRINVFDITCNETRRCYVSSGIQKIAREKGAVVYMAEDWNMIKAKFAYKSPMEDWPIFRDALTCDTFINLPVLKNHRLTTLTLSIKNLMGVCGGSRGKMHFNIAEKLVHLADFMKPDLTVIDAYRVLMDNGPSGGDLNDVVLKKSLIVGTDPVLTDAYASRLVDIDPMSIPYIKLGVTNKLGSADLAGARIERINTTP